MLDFNSCKAWQWLRRSSSIMSSSSGEGGWCQRRLATAAANLRACCRSPCAPCSPCCCLQVQRDFEELPQGAAQSLRDSLVALLVKHCQGNAAVRTQLCLAIAALAAHLPAAQWGPTGVVGWLAQRLGGEAQNVSLPCMLELLTVLPQVRGWLAGLSGGWGSGLRQWAARGLLPLLAACLLPSPAPPPPPPPPPTHACPAAGGQQLPARGAPGAAAPGD